MIILTVVLNIYKFPWCTGGQHRSVYLPIKLGEFLQEKYPDLANVTVTHNEQPQLN